MTLLATVVEWAELGKTVAGAAIAGIGVAIIFSLAVLGAARLIELRRTGQTAAAAAAGVLMGAALIAFAGAIAVGLIVMTDK